MAKPPFTNRSSIALANYHDKFIFVTGGCSQNPYHITANVYCYEISTDTWKMATPMNDNRYDHSSCALGNSLYVCAGKNERDEPIFSIERAVVEDCR